MAKLSQRRALSLEERATKARIRARKFDALWPGREVTADHLRVALSGTCAYCGQPAELTIDHIFPLSKGGKHVPNNVVGACGPCNNSKHNNPVEQWFRAQEFFDQQRWERIQTTIGRTN